MEKYTFGSCRLRTRLSPGAHPTRRGLHRGRTQHMPLSAADVKTRCSRRVEGTHEHRSAHMECAWSIKSGTRGPGWHPACAVGTISVVAPLTRGLRSMCRLLRDTCGVVAGAKVERPRPRYIHAFRRPPAANDRVRASALPGDLPRRRMRTYSITVLARCSPTCGGGRSACQCMSCRRCERSGASGAGTPSTQNGRKTPPC